MFIQTILYMIPMQLISFLHLPDIPSLENTSHEIKKLVYPYRSKLTFYGYPITNDMYQCFHSLFYSHYENMTNVLEERLDERGRGDRTRVDSFYSGPYRYALWNGMTMLEIAYLLYDFKAIRILKDHQRTICHQISAYHSEFGIEAVKLALQSGDEKVANLIWNQIHIRNREYFKQAEPELLSCLEI